MFEGKYDGAWVNRLKGREVNTGGRERTRIIWLKYVGSEKG